MTDNTLKEIREKIDEKVYDKICEHYPNGENMCFIKRLAAAYGYSLSQTELKEKEVEIVRLKGLIEMIYFNPEWTINKSEYDEVKYKYQQFKTENNL